MTETGIETLHNAIRHGELQTIEDIIEHHSELITAQDDEGNTSLHHAVTSESKIPEDVLDLLVDANLNVQTERGDTALHLACQSNNIDTVLYLLKHGADCNVLNDLHATAIDDYIADVDVLELDTSVFGQLLPNDGSHLYTTLLELVIRCLWNRT